MKKKECAKNLTFDTPSFSFYCLAILKIKDYICKVKGESTMIKFKEKTREELIAGFKRAIERKKEFEEQAQKEFADMRKRGAELKSAL